MKNLNVTGMLKLIMAFGCIVWRPDKILAQTDCSQIIQHGIYNYSSTDYYGERLQSLVNWFKSENIQTYQQAKSSSFNATIPIGKVMIGLGYSDDESGFQKLKNFIESYNSYNTGEKNQFAQTIKEIEPKIISAWTDCILKTSQGSVILWVEYTADPNTFNLCAMYSDMGAGTVTVGQLDFDLDTSRIKVYSEIFFKRNLTLNKNKKITSSILRQAITVKGEAVFNFNVMGMGPGLTYSFKPLREPPKEYLNEKLALKGTLVNSEARISGAPLTNTKGKTVYLHLTGTVKISPTTSLNRSAFRVTAKDNQSPDLNNPIVISFTPRWVIYDNLKEETTYKIDQDFLFRKDKDYFFEIYFDQADGVILKSELKYAY